MNIKNSCTLLSFLRSLSSALAVSLSLSLSLCLSLSLSLSVSKQLSALFDAFVFAGRREISQPVFATHTPGLWSAFFFADNLPALIVLVDVTNFQVFQNYNYLFLIISNFSMFYKPDDINYLCYLPLSFPLLYD
jgi:hypothetical protein